MSNEIDRLMALDPLDLSAGDIDAIIEYNRKLLSGYDSGVKPKKGEQKPPTLVELGIAKAKPTIKVRKIT
jgi:hypothetical protein